MLVLNLGHNPLYRHFCMYQHIELFKNQCDVSIQPLWYNFSTPVFLGLRDFHRVE